MAAESDLTAQPDPPGHSDRTFLDDTARALPWMQSYWTADPADLGSIGGALDGMVAATGRRWPSADAVARETLWWYLSSSTLTLVPVAQMLVTGTAFDVAPDALSVRSDPLGAVDALTSTRTVSGPDALGGSLRSLVEAVVARLPHPHPPSLWAIASDSLANRALDAGMALDAREDATDLAAEIAAACGRPMPAPRFVNVERRRFVRRSSCCLLYAVGDPQCVSCPHRSPDERTALWKQLARELT